MTGFALYAAAALGLALLSIFLLLVYRIQIAPGLSPLRTLPQVPKTSWLLGQWKEIAGEPPQQPQLRWAIQYGPISVFYAHFGSPRLLVTDPIALQHVSELC